MKNKITARHAGLGEVQFIIEADTKEAAFAKFKQIVYSVRQWNVTSNEKQQVDINWRGPVPKPGDPIPQSIIIRDHYYAHDSNCQSGGPNCDCGHCEEMEAGW